MNIDRFIDKSVELLTVRYADLSLDEDYRVFNARSGSFEGVDVSVTCLTVPMPVEFRYLVREEARRLRSVGFRGTGLKRGIQEGMKNLSWDLLHFNRASDLPSKN